MLCLPSGERMRLDARRLRIMFEVEDLSQASPATVSRCGMVYMPSDVTGWRAFARSWLAGFMERHWYRNAGSSSSDVVGDGVSGRDQQRAAQQQRPQLAAAAAAGGAAAPKAAAGSKSAELAQAEAFIWGLFESHVEPLLGWVRAHGCEALPSVDVSLVATLTALMDAICCGSSSSSSSKGGVKLCLGPVLTESHKVQLQYAFAFSAVWAIGGNLEGAAVREQFDGAARRLFDGTANFPGGSGTVFDYCLDPYK